MNVAIIGVGARSTAYTHLCLSNIRDDVSVKALADTNREKLEQYADKYFEKDKRPELFTDYNKLLEDTTIDAVIICTPDTTHREISVAAMKKGKHILLEKPMATTIEDCVAIHNESIKNDKVLKLGFVLRYTQLYSKIKEIVSGGVLNASKVSNWEIPVDRSNLALPLSRMVRFRISAE